MQDHEEIEHNVADEVNSMQTVVVNDINRGSSTNRNLCAIFSENVNKANRAMTEIWHLLNLIKLLEQAEEGA